MSPFGFCLNASTIRGTPILRQIEVASLAGYGGIELWFADVDAHLAQGGSLAELRRALDDRGLAVPTLIYLGGWFDASETEWPRIKAECGRRLEQAAALGAPHVIAGPPVGYADVVLGARRYRELLELGQTKGARPAMEFLGFVEQFNTIESALDVIERVAHPAASIVIDPFHIFRGDGSVESIALLRAEQIAVAHFNDTPITPPREQQHDRDRVWPGDGQLDLRRYLALLRQIGYDGWLSLELFREDLWQRDPLEVARIGLEKMRAVAASD
jgi:sugar phosphate isomerase/epimerase